MIAGIVASQVVDIGPPPDLAPVITSGNSVSVAENVTLSHVLTANESVTWSLVGGADQARFELSGSTLRWLSNGTKNFEAPDDADTNNTYIVTVRATDTALQTTDQTITATVTDADEVAPTLSSATGTATSDTEADLSVSTNEGNGTLYWVVTQSATDPTKAQVKLGQNHAGAAADDAGSQAVSGTGVQNITGGATGLTAETEYWAHFMHEDAATNQSDVATSASFETDAADTPPLDGLSNITGAWSFSRQLLTAYGGAFYADTAGEIDTLNDQSGAGRDFTGTLTARPTETTLGGEAAALFDGLNDFLESGVAISTFITNSVGYIVATVEIVATAAGDVTFNADCIFGDSGGFMGLHTTEDEFGSYNWDGNADYARLTGLTVEGTKAVVEWWHTGGNVHCRFNGSTTTSVASGNTSTMTGTLRIGRNSATTFPNMKLAEMVAFSVLPTLGERDALVADMMAHVGA